MHDPVGRPIFRSGPLAELPGPASDVVAGRRIDAAILDGAKQALDGGLKLIASIQMSLHDIPFPAELVSLTSLEIRGATVSPIVVARVHGGAISGPGNVIVTDS